MLRATYSKNPTLEDRVVLLHQLEELSKAEYLDFEVLSSNSDKEDRYFLYRITDKVEDYPLVLDLDNKPTQESVIKYNQIVNFRDRILAWKEYIDKVYDHIVNSGMSNRILPHVYFKEGLCFRTSTAPRD